MKNKQKDTKVLWKGQFLKEERLWGSRWPGRERGEKVPRGVDDSWDEAVRAEMMEGRYTREAPLQPRCLNGVGLGGRGGVQDETQWAAIDTGRTNGRRR